MFELDYTLPVLDILSIIIDIIVIVLMVWLAYHAHYISHKVSAIHGSITNDRSINVCNNPNYIK